MTVANGKTATATISALGVTIPNTIISNMGLLNWTFNNYEFHVRKQDTKALSDYSFLLMNKPSTQGMSRAIAGTTPSISTAILKQLGLKFKTGDVLTFTQNAKDHSSYFVSVGQKAKNPMEIVIKGGVDVSDRLLIAKAIADVIRSYHPNKSVKGGSGGSPYNLYNLGADEVNIVAQ